jgi:putative oxygen-independent coproporphyrinogen III oxidase
MQNAQATSLYVHWPFCVSKCPYCDFNSHVRDTVDQAAWRDALLSDLAYEASLNGGMPLVSIFFGGGTPSLMPPETVAAIIDEAAKLWAFAPGIEITLEANPSSVEAARFADLARAGVNRVSLGLQSLDDASLSFLGRAHSVTEGLDALAVAQRHFARVNFDLIYALPNQSAAQWEAALQQALSYGTDHLSLYQLTIEEGTRFATMVAQNAFTPVDPDDGAVLFELTAAMTEAAGLPAYETSNHAKAGQESRHNLTYWRYQDYLGIGPGAHGRRGGLATVRHKKPENWLAAVTRNGHGSQSEDRLSADESAREALVMGLRLAEGVNLDRIAARFGLVAKALVDGDRVQALERLGLVAHEENLLCVTPPGRLLLDRILAEIVII